MIKVFLWKFAAFGPCLCSCFQDANSEGFFSSSQCYQAYYSQWITSTEILPVLMSTFYLQGSQISIKISTLESKTCHSSDVR